MSETSKRANYFYCVRVTNPFVHDAIQDALDWVLDKDPQYTDFCYTKEMLHVTLCEVCLETENDIERASQALTSIEDELRANLPHSELTLKGITTFFDKVMVADVEFERDFLKFAEFFTRKMKQAGVNVVEKHAFRPHMTIMKVVILGSTDENEENKPVPSEVPTGGSLRLRTTIRYHQ
ncbi:uncharacterized protein LOC101852307 isoform X2 [Aplysia californica]|uniref:Uncharacterized protein LOC101852307 isoform X2 n=1 Tax=Aplysia californica TaxID=6500 RepID=A0ABM0JGE3_APLCA|nr:uncharacterized protein LOC101852307 isoform X2 [Aplysia californica]